MSREARQLPAGARRTSRSANSAKMPPSPRLPARMIRMAYLNETITISDQRITDTMPMMVSGESVRGACGLLDSIERAGADIAVDDAECRESRGDGQLTRSNPGHR